MTDFKKKTKGTYKGPNRHEQLKKGYQRSISKDGPDPTPSPKAEQDKQKGSEDAP